MSEAPASPSSLTFSKTIGVYPFRFSRMASTGPATPQPMISTVRDIVGSCDLLTLVGRELSIVIQVQLSL